VSCAVVGTLYHKLYYLIFVQVPTLRIASQSRLCDHMLARRPLFAFVHSTVAQLCTRPRWSPTSDSSMCLSPLDVFARTSSRFSCATRRGMTFLGPTASQKLSEVAPKGSKGGNNALRRRQTRFERVFARNLEQLLRRWGRHYPESIQSDGFIRVKRIVCPL